MNRRLLILILFFAPALLYSLSTWERRPLEIPFAEFQRAADEGRIAEVTIRGRDVSGKYRDEAGRPGALFRTVAPDASPDLETTLRGKGIVVTVPPDGPVPWHVTFLVQWAPAVLLFAVWAAFMLVWAWRKRRS